MDSGQHLSSRPFEHVLDLEVPSLPRLAPTLQELEYLRASINLLLDPARYARHVPFDRRIGSSFKAAEVTVTGGESSPTHNLHVLLRHRPPSIPSVSPSARLHLPLGPTLARRLRPRRCASRWCRDPAPATGRARRARRRSGVAGGAPRIAASCRTGRPTRGFRVA